mmetsp:Transcript_9264/g.16122  ORF Transcript_9264/g.16122 Transcript_9264/m.16122 type:complete len:80 (-) Transcript_9264:525-764(-)
MGSYCFLSKPTPPQKHTTATKELRTVYQHYRITEPGIPAGNNSPPALFSFCGPGKTCQNLRVSSPAPVTIVDPSGESAK